MTCSVSAESSKSCRVDLLTQETRDEMFTVFQNHFDGVTRRQFDRDLEEKNWAITLRRADKLVGFSTLLATNSTFEGGSLTALYSGDTIVAPEAWGTPALSRAWIALVNQLRSESPNKPCYWLLLSSGFRTYRFLPVFWKTFFPRHDVRTPPRSARLMQHLASERYGKAYDSQAGLVRFCAPQMLRGNLANLPGHRSHDPHIAFFLRSNPGHAAGDELVCLTEIAEHNLTRAGQRMIHAEVR